MYVDCMVDTLLLKITYSVSTPVNAAVVGAVIGVIIVCCVVPVTFCTVICCCVGVYATNKRGRRTRVTTFVPDSDDPPSSGVPMEVSYMCYNHYSGISRLMWHTDRVLVHCICTEQMH